MTIPVGRVAKEGKASPPGMVLVKRFCPHRPYLLPLSPGLSHALSWSPMAGGTWAGLL